MTAAEWVARVGASESARRDAESLLVRLPHSEPFADDRDIIVARAPGRLDVMGGIADYSGSLVLEWPLADATFVALQRDPNPTLTIVSVGSGWRCSATNVASASGHWSTSDPE